MFNKKARNLVLVLIPLMFTLILLSQHTSSEVVNSNDILNGNQVTYGIDDINDGLTYLNDSYISIKGIEDYYTLFALPDSFNLVSSEIETISVAESVDIELRAVSWSFSPFEYNDVTTAWFVFSDDSGIALDTSFSDAGVQYLEVIEVIQSDEVFETSVSFDTIDFDGFYETNPNLASYVDNEIFLSIYILCEGHTDGPVFLLKVFKISFKDEYDLAEQLESNYFLLPEPKTDFFLNDPNLYSLYETFGKNYHSINLFEFYDIISGITSDITSKVIEYSDGATYTESLQSIMYFDKNVDRINSYSDGYNDAKITFELEPNIVLTSQTHNVYHEYEYTVSIPTVPSATVSLDLSEKSILLPSNNFLYDEGYRDLSIFNRAYRLEVTFYQGGIMKSVTSDVRLGFDSGLGDDDFFFLINLPKNAILTDGSSFRFVIRAVKRLTDLTSLSFEMLDMDKSVSGSDLILSWNNLPSFTPLWDGSSFSGNTLSQVMYRKQGSVYNPISSSILADTTTDRFSLLLSGIGGIFSEFKITFTFGASLKEFIFTFNPVAPAPSGDIATVGISSADTIIHTDNEIYDVDGNFLLSFDVTDVQNTEAFVIWVFRFGLSFSSDPSIYFVSALNNPETVSLDNKYLVIDDGSNILQFSTSLVSPSLADGIVYFLIIPLGTGGIGNVYGDDPSETASVGISENNGFVKVIIQSKIDPTIRFWDGKFNNNLAITSDNGFYACKYAVEEPNTDILSSSFTNRLTQTVSSTDYTVDYITYTNEMALDVPAFANVIQYTSSAGTFGGVVDQIRAEIPSGIDYYRRIIDGTYEYRSWINYEIFGLSNPSNSLFMTIQSSRTLDVNGNSVGITSTTGQYSLNWNQMNPNRRTASLDVALETETSFFIILYGRNINPTDFKSDLTQIDTSKVKILYTPSGMARFNSFESTVTIDGDGNWGNSDGINFFSDFSTDGIYYFAVVPVFYSTISGKYYNGEISNIVTVTLNKNVFMSSLVTPSVIRFGMVDVYTQDKFTVEGWGEDSIQDAVSADLYFVYEATQEMLTMAFNAGSGAFEVDVYIFSIISGSISSSFTLSDMKIEFTFDKGGGIFESIDWIIGIVNVITGIVPDTEYISPNEDEVIPIGIDRSFDMIVRVTARTDPLLAYTYGLPAYTVSNPSFITITRVREIIGGGFGLEIPSVNILQDGVTWTIHVNDLFDFPQGVTRFRIDVEIDDGNVFLSTSFIIEVRISYKPSFTVIAPSKPVGGVITWNKYDPITIRWVNIFGTEMFPDRVFLRVIKNNNELYFEGIIPLTIIYYQFYMNPLLHKMTDFFDFYIFSSKGNGEAILNRFKIQLNFKVFVNINLNVFEYEVSDPVINGDIEAWIIPNYPAFYNHYFFDFGRLVSPTDYYIERNFNNGTISLIFPSAQFSNNVLEFEMTENPSPSWDDRLVFFKPSPTLTRDPWFFTDEGTVYNEELFLTSTLYHEDITLQFDPSFTSFDPSDDERWNVTVNGVDVEYTLVGNTFTIFFDEINAGEVKSILLVHYYVDDEEPEPEPEPNWFIQLLMAIISFIMTILSLIFGGLFIARKRAKQQITI